MRVKIKKIDEYGFCGRENHPDKTDEGQIATVYAAESEAYLGCEPLYPDEIERNPSLLQDERFNMVMVYKAFMSDGSKRTLMSFEVEEVK